MIQCNACHQELPESAFHHLGDGLQRRCKECQKAARARMLARRDIGLVKSREHGSRKCTECGETKPIEEFGLSGHGYRRRNCKACEVAHNRAYYIEHAEARKAAARQDYYANTEARRQRFKDWYARNRGKQLEYSRQYNLRRRTTSQTYERLRRATPEGRARNRHYSRIRWDRLRKASEGQEPFTRAEIIKRDGTACYICNRHVAGRFLQFDHVIPLAKGGKHCRENVRVCCWECNNKKRARLE